MEYSYQVHNFDKFRPSRQATKIFYASENLPPDIRPPQHSSASEAKRENLTFYGEMKRAMIILRILGLLPYSTTSAGDVCFKWLSVATFYSIVCVSTVATLGGFTLVERFKLSMDFNVSFGYKTIEYGFRLLIWSVFIIPTNHWPETGKKIKFINSWTELQTTQNCEHGDQSDGQNLSIDLYKAEYKNITGRHLCLGLQRKVSSSLVVMVGVVTSFTALVHLNDNFLRWWQYITIIFAITVTVLLPLIWVFTCAALTKVATELADDIEKHFSSRGFGKIRKIASYKTLWLHLSKLTQEFGNANGLTYGGQTLILFAISVLVVYGFMIELTERFSFVLSCTGLLFQVIIFSQCNSAHGTANEVGTKFGERLQAIINKLPPANAEEINEMRQFLAVIESNPPIISFCGFVDVNRTLITSLISSMVTYLVVLMQFHLSHDTPHQNSSSA